MADPKLTPGTLYIDRDQDLLSGEWGPYIKIGIVRNDKEAALRNKEHQTGNPRRIHVMYAFESTMVEELETQLHHIFAPYRVLGEWFLLDDQAVASRVIPEAKRIIAEQCLCLGTFQSKAKLKTIESTGIVRAPTPEEIQLHSLVVKAKHDLDIKQAKLDVTKGMLINCAKNSSGISGVLELQRKLIKPALQKPKLKTEHPEVYQYYETIQLSEPKGSIMVKGTSSLKKLDTQLYNEKYQATGVSPFSGQHLDMPLCERNPTIIDYHSHYLRGLGDAAIAGWIYESLRTELAVQLGDDEGIDGLIAWKRVCKEESKFDASTFAADHPALYKTYLAPEKISVATMISLCRPYNIN
jgi:hypothetical protein